ATAPSQSAPSETVSVPSTSNTNAFACSTFWRRCWLCVSIRHDPLPRRGGVVPPQDDPCISLLEVEIGNVGAFRDFGDELLERVVRPGDRLYPSGALAAEGGVDLLPGQCPAQQQLPVGQVGADLSAQTPEGQLLQRDIERSRAGDGEDAVAHLGVDRGPPVAEAPEDVLDDLIPSARVALTGLHVEEGLRGDELGEGGDHDGVPQLGPDADNLREDFVEPILGADFREVPPQGGHHPARYL